MRVVNANDAGEPTNPVTLLGWLVARIDEHLSEECTGDLPLLLIAEVPGARIVLFESAPNVGHGF